ncbi:MAG: hypothetical protein AMXMBFR53_07850 [Gemmatimonadota bacterium]
MDPSPGGLPSHQDTRTGCHLEDGAGTQREVGLAKGARPHLAEEGAQRRLRARHSATGITGRPGRRRVRGG